MNLKHVSKCISHALRHEPWLYELELDDNGWVPLDMLIESLRAERQAWAGLMREHIHELIRTAAKQRFEVKGDRIRAIYGHSVPGKLKHEAKAPPAVLYHGTDPAILETIMSDGLLPMYRQFVHLSADKATALEVGRRKAGKPVLLLVRAEEAAAAGHAFYEGNDKVWLADHVPGAFLDT